MAKKSTLGGLLHLTTNLITRVIAKLHPSSVGEGLVVGLSVSYGYMYDVFCKLCSVIDIF